MPQGNVYSRNCSGNVSPSVFVKNDSANPQKVVQCSANTDNPLGISQESAYQPPIPQLTGTQYAGTTTSPPIRIYGQGCDQVLLTIGSGGCTAGDSLTPDANGAGVTASSNQIVGAIANETRAQGELCRVTVVSPHPLT